MANLETKKMFTTGDVAKLLSVAPRTVSKMFDSGKLVGFRLPGSLDRRIPRDELLKFLRENKMPIPEELEPKLIGTANPLEAMVGTLDLSWLDQLFKKRSVKFWDINVMQDEPLVSVVLHWTLNNVPYKYSFNLTNYTLLEGLQVFERVFNGPILGWKEA